MKAIANKNPRNSTATATCIGARILRLNKYGYIGEHSDGYDFNNTRFRCHIPLTKCYPDCWMNINKDQKNLRFAKLLFALFNNFDI